MHNQIGHGGEVDQSFAAAAVCLKAGERADTALKFCLASRWPFGLAYLVKIDVDWQSSLISDGHVTLADRRSVIVLIGASAAALPFAACNREEAMPVIGFLSPSPPLGNPRRLPPFREGLKEVGYVEGQNVAIEYRWANGQYQRLPELADDLVRRQVTVIAATGGTSSALAAKGATSTIPIVFTTGDDPVQVGLVASLNRPGGNATGMSMYTTDTVAKRLEVLRELVPKAGLVGLLVNPNGAKLANQQMEDEIRLSGLRPLVFEVGAESDLEKAFALAAHQSVDVLLVSADPFFTIRRRKLVSLAAEHALPAAYPWREYVEVGGLMSYAPDDADVYRELGVYAGRIVKGSKASDLPVQLPKKFDLVINLNTAKALGLTVPRALFARADQMID